MGIIAISGKIGSGKDTVSRIIQYLTLDIPPHEDHTLEKIISGEFDISLEAHSTWKRKRFAGKLKQMVSLLTGISIQDLEKQEVKDSYLGEEWDKIVEYYQDRFKGTPEEFEDHLRKNVDNIVLNSINSVAPYNEGNSVIYHVYYKKKIEKMKVRDLLQKLGTEALREVIHPNVHVNALFADYKQEVISSTSRSEMTLRKDITISRTLDYPNWLITDLRFPNEAKAVKENEGICIRVRRNQFLKADTLHTHEHPSETALDYYKDWDYEIDNEGTIKDLVDKVKKILVKEGII